jgi:hypothetical protein
VHQHAGNPKAGLVRQQMKQSDHFFAHRLVAETGLSPAGVARTSLHSKFISTYLQLLIYLSGFCRDLRGDLHGQESLNERLEHFFVN